MIEAVPNTRLRSDGKLQRLAASILEAPDDNDLIRHYFDEAISSEQLDRAKLFFEELLNRYPNHHQARTLYISTCLQLGAHQEAMAAIETFIVFSDADDSLFDAALKVREKIGPIPIRVSEKSNTGESISVCMIVRNEQRYLASCLNSIKQIAAEIVLIDTGSEDRTIDIGRIFGARVSRFQWRDDFAAARNAGLEKAEGDWILILDADELIAEQDQARLQKILENHRNTSTAFSMETRNYTHNANAVTWHSNDGSYPRHESGIGWFPSKKIRLFPNNPKIRFQFPVHELVDPSVRSVGCMVKDCAIPIHHYGHLNEEKNRKKAESYFYMGYTKLEQLGDDIAAIRELAVQAGQLGLWPESLALWRRLLRIRPDFIEAFVNMSGASWQMAQYQEAVEFAAKAIHLRPGSKEARYNLAVSYLMIGRAVEAFSELDRLQKETPDYIAAKFMSAAAAVCMDAPEAGIEIFKELKNTSVGPALAFGIQDLIKRLQKGGRADDASKLHRCIKLLNVKQ